MVKNKNIYLTLWNYIKESQNYIYFSIGIFVLAIFAGFFVEPSQNIQKLIVEYIQKVVEQTAGMNFLELFWFIFKNNFTVAFFSLLFGVIFGVFPVLMIVFNGYIIGFVSKLAVNASGIGSLWSLVPHGIFEIPAILITFSLGMRVGMFLFSKDIKKSFIQNERLSWLVFLYIVLPLLFVAALIESFLIYLS